MAGGITFLERAHVIHPDASRVLLVAMDRHGTGASWAINGRRAAMNSARFDTLHLVGPRSRCVEQMPAGGPETERLQDLF